LPHMLHIVAWSSQITVISPIHDGSNRDARYESFVDLEDKGPRTLNVFFTGEAPLYSGTCIGIHLGSGDDEIGSNEKHLFLLIVQEVELGSSVYERVGFGAIKTTMEDYAADSPSIVDPTFGLPLVVRDLPLPKLVKRRQELWIH
jgi:hypothetical protein